jgi:hypothetical protein
MTIREQGWECPKCSRVWAPKINACGACNSELSPPAWVGTPPQPQRMGQLISPSAPWTPTWNWTAEDPSFTS